MSARKMEEEQERREEERASSGDAAEDDVEILGIEAVDESEIDSGDFVLEEELEEAAPVAPPAAAATGEPAGPEVDELRKELAMARDRNLRLLADFDNFRKRVERDRAESSRFAVADSVRELLPVVDNLERAIAASGDADDLRKGVEMTARQFLEALRRFGVEPVPAVGEEFDPQVHEAVQRTERPDAERPTVIEEFQRGYRLQGRLVRPALVKVAMPPESGDHDAGGEGGDDGDGEGAE